MPDDRLYRFTEAVRVELLAALRGGASLVEACARAGVPLATVKSWMQRGRDEESTPHAAFTEAVGPDRHTTSGRPPRPAKII